MALKCGWVLRLKGDRGGTLPFIALLLPALVLFTGLAFDGGTIFTAKREALNVATAAARRGAADVSEDSLLEGRPRLAPSAAGTAASFAAGQGYAASAGVLGGERDRVQVTVTGTVDTAFLTFVGISQVTVTESAISQVQTFANDGP